MLQDDMLFVLYIYLAIRAAISYDRDGFELEGRRSSRSREEFVYPIRAGVLEMAGFPLGMFVNAEKPKVLALHQTDCAPMRVRTGPVEECIRFTYPGYNIPNVLEDIRRRSCTAWVAMDLSNE